MHGVGFAIRNSIVRKVESLPRGMNERLMTLHIPIALKQYAMVIGAYAPTIKRPEDAKDKF